MTWTYFLEIETLPNEVLSTTVVYMYPYCSLLDPTGHISLEGCASWAVMNDIYRLHYLPAQEQIRGKSPLVVLAEGRSGRRLVRLVEQVEAKERTCAVVPQ